MGWWNTDTLIDRAETTGLGGDGAQNGDSPPSPEGSLDVGMSRRKSITEGMIEQVNSESSESLEQFLMGKRERLLHQPLAAVAERGFPPMPTSVVDMEELPEMQNINLEGTAASGAEIAGSKTEGRKTPSVVLCRPCGDPATVCAVQSTV